MCYAYKYVAVNIYCSYVPITDTVFVRIMVIT